MSPNRMNIRRAAATILAVAQIGWLCAPALVASERRLGGSLLEMHHRAGKFVDPSNNNQASIKERPVYVLRKGDTVAVVVVDQNPLLFTFGTELTAEETEQHKIAVEFAQTLVKLVDVFKSTKVAGATREVIVEGLNIKGFREDLGILQTRLLALPTKITQSVGTAGDIVSLKTDVSGWDVSGLADRILKGYEKVGVIAAKCLSGRALDAGGGQSIRCSDAAEPVSAQAAASITDGADERAAAGGPSDGRFESQPQVISNNPPPKPVAGATPQSPTPANASPVAPVLTPPPAAPAGETIQGFITLAIAMQSKVESSLTLLKAFAGDVAAINTARPLPPSKDQEVVAYSINNQTMTITVGQNTKYEDFLSTMAKQVRKDGVGKYPIDLKPYTPAMIGLKPAFVVLFGKNPTFKAVKSGAEYEIQAEDPQGTGYNVAAMLTITPRAWAEPTFGGQFQVGVSPTKGKIGIYLGAGVSVQEVFTFGLGVSWQEVGRLASGLVVGQKIATADLLKTGTEYRPGLYFHITTALPSAK